MTGRIGGKTVEYKQKRAVIEGLLDHWQDFVLPSVGGNMVSDGEVGDGIVFASGMGRWPAVRELDKILGVYRRYRPRRYRMIVAYFGSEWKTADVWIKRRNARGRLIDVMERRRVRVLPREVADELRERRCRERDCPCGNAMPAETCYGLDELLALWDPRVKLKLPPALNRKLREFVDSDGTHLTEAA